MKKSEYTIYFIMPEGNWSDLNQNMFSDLNGDARVTVLQSRFKPIQNKILCFLRQIHYSRRINHIVNLPFKNVWKYTLDDINYVKDKRYILIFPDTVSPITKTYIQKLKNDYDVICVLFLLNTQAKNHMDNTRPYIPYMDYIFTFDYADARKFGYIECNSLYSKLDIVSDNNVVKDLYYIGYDKGRLSTIQRIISFANNNEVDVLIRVMGVDIHNNRVDNTNNVVYNIKISYNESLKELLASNCILELLSAGQYGATLRYYEAVCYNKKLLTNNKNVVNLPFYNPDYIHVFEKPEDIDWDWVKERIPVDYHYDGRFSPIHLIDKIIQLEEGKEAPDCG